MIQIGSDEIFGIGLTICIVLGLMAFMSTLLIHFWKSVRKKGENIAFVPFTLNQVKASVPVALGVLILIVWEFIDIQHEGMTTFLYLFGIPYLLGLLFAFQKTSNPIDIKDPENVDVLK